MNVETGAVAASFDYSPFGVLEREDGALAARFPFRFAGGLWDGDTGLVRFGARDYDPRVGRWTAKDPILWGGGQGNLYEYVGSEPNLHTDPTGLIVDSVSATCARNPALCGMLAGAGVAMQRIGNRLASAGPAACRAAGASLSRFGSQLSTAVRVSGSVPRALFGQVKIQRHHIFPQRFRAFFRARGIDIDRYTVELTEGRHLKSVHGRGDLLTPGRFNAQWERFIEMFPNASALEVYQYGGWLMDQYGLSGLMLVPYR